MRTRGYWCDTLHSYSLGPPCDRHTDTTTATAAELVRLGRSRCSSGSVRARSMALVALKAPLAEQPRVMRQAIDLIAGMPPKKSSAKTSAHAATRFNHAHGQMGHSSSLPRLPCYPRGPFEGFRKPPRCWPGRSRDTYS